MNESIRTANPTRPPRFAALRARIALMVATLLLSCGGDGGNRPLSLVLISIDTIRPAHLGCYGNDAIETPHIDRLAASGVRFDNCVASAPITLPSHASILTGQYPFRHRVRNNGRYELKEEKESMAESLQRSGHETAAFVGAFPLASQFGLAQGFDFYDDDFDAQMKIVFDFEERRAEDVTDASLTWLEDHAGDDFFLFVHYYDPHFTYAPPEPYATEYADNPYDGEVAYVDAQIGRLLEGLRAHGADDRTVVVVTGDHGESFGEHDEKTHAIFIYDATIRIPLIIHWPDRAAERVPWERGSTVDALVRSIDIAPTSLGMLDAPPLAEAQGVDLTRSGAMAGIENAYAESFAPKEDYGWSSLRSIRTTQWKYVKAPRPELYDMKNDPRETTNVIDDHPEIAARLAQELEAWVTEDRSRGADDTVPMDDETRAKLEALGYVTRGGGSDASEEEPEIDPKDRVLVTEKLFEGERLRNTGEYQRAIDLLSEVVAEDPQNPRAWKTLSDAYLSNGDLEEAKNAIERGIAVAPENQYLRVSEAHWHSLQGNYDRSNEILRGVMLLDPDYTGAHGLIAENYMKMRDWEGAIKEYEAEIEKDPESMTGWNGLGAVYASSGDLERAVETFRRATEIAPDDAQSYFNLAKVLGDRNDPEQSIRYYQEAIRVNPKFMDSYYNLAHAYAAGGSVEKAITTLQKAIRVDPTYGNAYVLLGNMSREAGAHDAAIRHYRTGLNHDPHNANLLLGLGTSLANIGRVEEAIPVWEAAMSAAPGTAAAQSAAANRQKALRSLGR